MANWSQNPTGHFSLSTRRLDALSAIYAVQPNNQPVSYTLFYTPTAGLMQDIEPRAPQE
jgi:hypothetical protein